MKLGDAKPEADTRVYAIGDVHGCADQLRELISLIDLDQQTRPSKNHKIIFLGDYVDRGPANREVIEYLIELKNSPRNVEFVLGNHDERILSFLEDPALVWDNVMRWGGARTLEDYGIVPDPSENEEQVSARFGNAFPDDHFAFLQSLPRFTSSGDYFFCHAGVRPDVPLSEQTDQDLIWIRYDFLLHEGEFEKVVVHGHTPGDEPEVKTNRINVDTHCYESGVLTAVVLEDTNYRFLQTR